MKIAKWFAAGIGIIVILGILAALTSNLIFGHQFRKALGKLQAEGRPTTVAQLKTKTIPADRNAAPLIEKAALLLENKSASTSIQELSTFVQEFMKIGYQNRALGFRDLPESERERLKRLLEEPDSKALYAILSEAAHKPGYSRSLKLEEASALRIPPFQVTRQLMEFLILNAEAAAYKGNAGEAGQVLLEGFRLANLMKLEPITIQLLISIASDAILVNSLCRITDGADLPADTLQSLEAELKNHLNEAPYVHAMDEDRAVALRGYQALLNGTYGDVRTVAGGIIGKYSPAHYWVYRTFGLLHRDMAIFLTLHAEIQDKCSMPSYGATAYLRHNPIQNQIPAFCPLSGIMLQASASILNTRSQTEALLQVTRVGLALKRYKIEKGVYPDALAYLEPSFLEKLPKDPCSGNSLLYQKEGKGFLLYSVGIDLQDNHGAQVNPKWPYGSYDIVWKTAR